MNIEGCQVLLQDGSSKTVSTLRLASNSEYKRDRRRTRALDKGVGKVRGLGYRPSQIPSAAELSVSDTTEDAATSLVYNVVPAQPLLWIRNTSLTHGSVMTHHGER